MAKKKDENLTAEDQELDLGFEADEITEGAEPDPAEKAEPEEDGSEKEPESEEPLFTEHLWKGVRTVYRCAQCGHCEDDKGDMQLHVLVHFPEVERETILSKLLED